MKRLLALSLLLAPLALAGEPEVLLDEWLVVRLYGADAGYEHTRAVRTGDVIETTVETELVMKRGGATLKITATEKTTERAADGSLVGVHATRKMSGSETELDVRFDGTKAVMVTKVAGRANETKQEIGEGVVGPHRIDALTREAARKEGSPFATRMYFSDFGGPTDLTITVRGPEEVELLDGRKERLVRVERHFTRLGYKETHWLDATGQVRKKHVNAGGMDMEAFLATEERARRGAATPPAALPDALTNSLLAPLHPIPHPRRVDRATYRIRAKEKMPDFADGRQTVATEEGGAIVLRVERKVPAEGAAKRPIADVPEDLAPCLAANSMVQSDAPEIRNLAAEIVGDETDAWKAARRIETWVHDNIKEKSMDVAFASALEVCRDRKGDCTEHAILLCALARAAGIPSRVIMGLTCIGDAFGGHAWTEVWIGGGWYALDGTLGHGSADATHLAFARMTYEDNAGADAFAGLMQGLGQLEVDPLEVVIEGRTLRPAADAGTVEGDRYVSRLWSIAFTCPEGLEFDEPDKRAGMTARIMEVEGKTADGTRCEIGIEATDATVWDMILSVKGAAFDSCEETTVDGRPALRVAKGDRRGVYVKTDLGVFSFSMEAKGDDAAAALDALLASVDFDVK